MEYSQEEYFGDTLRARAFVNEASYAVFALRASIAIVRGYCMLNIAIVIVTFLAAIRWVVRDISGPSVWFLAAVGFLACLNVCLDLWRLRSIDKSAR